MSLCCRSCHGTGRVYIGNGHRSDRYPYEEKTSARACGCGRTPRESSAEVIAAHKVAFEKRADAYVAKVSREMDVMRAKPGYKEPLWFIEQQRQIGETT